MSIKLKLLITLFAVFLVIAIPMSATLTKRTDGGRLRHALELKTAISSYFTEYRKFPGPAGAAEDSDQPMLSDDDLMKSLLRPIGDSGSDSKMSPRRIYFDSSFPPAKMSAPGKYRSGILVKPDGRRVLIDHWGNLYRVVVDTSGDGRIPAPSFDPAGEPIKTDVIVWSPGPDCNDATVEDNIMTWR